MPCSLQLIRPRPWVKSFAQIDQTSTIYEAISFTLEIKKEDSSINQENKDDVKKYDSILSLLVDVGGYPTSDRLTKLNADGSVLETSKLNSGAHSELSII